MQIDALLTERQKTHGRWEENARISQGLLRVLRTGSRWAELADSQLEALQMISHKEHRIVNGDPNVPDHWDDIAGYATLEANRLRGGEKDSSIRCGFCQRGCATPEEFQEHLIRDHCYGPVLTHSTSVKTSVDVGQNEFGASVLWTGAVQDVINFPPPWPHVERQTQIIHETGECHIDTVDITYYLPDRSRIDPVVVEEQLCRLAGKLPRMDYENLHPAYRSLYTKETDGDEYVLLPEFAGWAS